MLGKARSSASLISPGWRRASCRWRSTGLVTSTQPSGLVFRNCIFKASCNFTPFKVLISSTNFRRILGRTASKKSLGSVLRGCPSGISICQPRRNCSITHRVWRKASSSVLTCLLLSQQTSPGSLSGSPGLFEEPSSEAQDQNSFKMPILFRFLRVRGGREGRGFPWSRDLSKRRFIVLGMGSSMMFRTTS